MDLGSDCIQIDVTDSKMRLILNKGYLTQDLTPSRRSLFSDSLLTTMQTHLKYNNECLGILTQDG
ncbi:hypothetical protein IMCC3135_28340 [Granulosicoccus antarcticus IMCC3135]|uniref:Uncharacterized protein n=1 Tax=Granulosicoccus antarcticus IMCC3135 TaxID=1192854 RepID=A0A2Z2P2W5_9GAMM|nr:hypothetical protein IMCC3135_28340 [Granulosicoccus antarcticus IMCC3135]